MESKTPWWLVQGHSHSLKSGVAHEPKPRGAHENDGGKRPMPRVSRPPPSISMSRNHRPMRAIAVPAGSHSVAATEPVDTRASPPPLPTCVSFLSLPCPNVHPSARLSSQAIPGSYSWVQGESDISVHIPIGHEITKKDVDFKEGKGWIRVGLKVRIRKHLYMNSGGGRGTGRGERERERTRERKGRREIYGQAVRSRASCARPGVFSRDLAPLTCLGPPPRAEQGPDPCRQALPERRGQHVARGDQDT